MFFLLAEMYASLLYRFLMADYLRLIYHTKYNWYNYYIASDLINVSFLYLPTAYYLMLLFFLNAQVNLLIVCHSIYDWLLIPRRYI